MPNTNDCSFVFSPQYHKTLEVLNVFLIQSCVRVSVAVERHHDHSNSWKGKRLIGAGLVHHGRKHAHGGMQADMVLEKELKFYIFIHRQ